MGLNEFLDNIEQTLGSSMHCQKHGPIYFFAIFFSFCSGIGIYAGCTNQNIKYIGLTLMIFFGLPIVFFIFACVYTCIRDSREERSSQQYSTISPVCHINAYEPLTIQREQTLLPCKKVKKKEDALEILQKTVKNTSDPVKYVDFEEMTVDELRHIVVIGEHGYTAQTVRDFIQHGIHRSPLNPNIRVTSLHYSAALQEINDS